MNLTIFYNQHRDSNSWPYDRASYTLQKAPSWYILIKLLDKRLIDEGLITERLIDEGLFDEHIIEKSLIDKDLINV